MYTTRLQHILCDRLLFIITSEQESNFSSGFKLKIYNNMLIRICCENIVDVVFSNLKSLGFAYMCVFVHALPQSTNNFEP